MKLRELTCPKCGAPLPEARNGRRLECAYCGTAFLLDEDGPIPLPAPSRKPEAEKKPEAVKPPFHPASEKSPSGRTGSAGPAEQAGPAEDVRPAEESERTWINLIPVLLILAILLLFFLPSGKASPSNQPSPSPIPKETSLPTDTPIPANTPKPTATSAPTATPVPKKRDSYPDFGMGDTRVQRPNYTGMTGYAAVTRLNLDFPGYLKDFNEADWVVTTYEKDKQFWNKTGTIPHKTRVRVLEQITENNGYSRLGVTGYLYVEATDTHERFYMKVSNFVTDPYWLYDVYEATATSYVVAEYRQVSNYYPMERDKSKVELEDGTLVLCIGLTGTFGNIGPDKETNQIETYVIGPIYCNAFFNVADLTVVY